MKNQNEIKRKLPTKISGAPEPIDPQGILGSHYKPLLGAVLDKQGCHS